MYMHLAVEIILSSLTKVIKEVVSMDNEMIVVGDDWNNALNLTIDTNQPFNVYRARRREKIIEFMHDYDLVDIYRTLHSDIRKHSSRRFNGTQRSRFDYFLVSELLGLEIVSADMPGYCSDHSLLCIVLKMVTLKDTAPCGNSITHSFEIRCL